MKSISRVVEDNLLADDMLGSRRAMGVPFGETDEAFSSESAYISEPQRIIGPAKKKDYKVFVIDQSQKLGRHLCSLFNSVQPAISPERWRM